MSGEDSTSKQIYVFRSLLHQNGYSKKAIEEICKWFDGSEEWVSGKPLRKSL